MEEGKEAIESTEAPSAPKQETAVPKTAAHKDAFMANFEEKHGLVEQETETSTETDESTASVVKDEPVQTPKEGPKKAVPEGYVRKEALDEERSRRKRQSQKLTQLQEEYGRRIKDLESKLKSPSASQSEDTAEEDLTDREKALMAKLNTYEAERKQTEVVKQQETVAEKQTRLNKQISEVDKELRESGFAGFRLGAHLVDQKLRELLENEEIDDVDYLDPKMWKRVYMESIHAEVAKEFGFATKQAINEKKNAAKENAAKAASIAGSKDEVKKPSNDEDEEYDPQKDMAAYLKDKRQKAPRSRF